MKKQKTESCPEVLSRSCPATTGWPAFFVAFRHRKSAYDLTFPEKGDIFLRRYIKINDFELMEHCKHKQPTTNNERAPLKIGFRRLFASGQSPTGKIFGGSHQAATLKSSCIVLFAHTLKIHPIKFLEIPERHSKIGSSPVSAAQTKDASLSSVSRIPLKPRIIWNNTSSDSFFSLKETEGSMHLFLLEIPPKRVYLI